MELSERVERIKPSPTLAVAARAEELQAAGKDIISLSLGEPDFDTPEHIKEAGIKAIRDGHTKYTPVDGTKGLKKAIIDKFARENNLHYELSQILVSNGAKHSIYNALSVLLNPGDEVIIPAPYWVSYPDMVMLCSGNPVFIQTHHTQGFKLQPEQLEAAITPKTRAFIINSPSNPTGVSYTKAELAALGEVIKRYPQIAVLSDDIYEHHQWNHKPFNNILNACPELYSQVVVINSVSKTYAMTGWRIGYAGGPAKIIGAMRKAQSQNTSSPNTIAQYASEAALNGSQECVREMTKAYKTRHDYIFSELQKIPGIDCMPSDGTFYTFPNVKKVYEKLNMNSDVEFAEFLLNKAEVAVIPGTAFGGPGHIRICYTTSLEKLKIGMTRIRSALGLPAL